MLRIRHIKQTAMTAAQQAYAAASDGRSLIADIADGALLKAKPLPGFAKFAAKIIVSFIGILIDAMLSTFRFKHDEDRQGAENYIAERLAWMEELSEFPIAATFELGYDNFPAVGTTYRLVDGPWKGYTWKCTREREKRARFKGGAWYEWDGYNMVFVEPPEEESPIGSDSPPVD